MSRLPLALIAALWSLAGCTCESERVEQQREVLKPKDHRHELAQLVDDLRLTTPEGELRPSDAEVAGLRLPRGLSLLREFEHEWYYRTEHDDLTLPRLEEYFRKQLVTLKLRRAQTGGMWFVDAQLKDAPRAPLVTVRLSPVRNNPRRNEVYIRQRPPPRSDAPDPAEAAAQLEARRRYAD